MAHLSWIGNGFARFGSSSRLGCRAFKRVLRGIVNVTPKTRAAARMLMLTVPQQ